MAVALRCRVGRGGMHQKLGTDDSHGGTCQCLRSFTADSEPLRLGPCDALKAGLQAFKFTYTTNPHTSVTSHPFPSTAPVKVAFPLPVVSTYAVGKLMNEPFSTLQPLRRTRS